MSMKQNLTRWVSLLVLGAGLLAAGMAPAEEQSGSRNRAQAHAELGAAYFARGQMGVALDELNEAVRADSGYAPAYNILGLIYMTLREDAKAEENFRRSLSLDSADSDAHNNYGWFLCQRGQIDESIRHFMAALKNPLYATPEKSYLNAGICSRKKDNNDAEAEDFLAERLGFRFAGRGASRAEGRRCGHRLDYHGDRVGPDDELAGPVRCDLGQFAWPLSLCDAGRRAHGTPETGDSPWRIQGRPGVGGGRIPSG